MYDKKTPISRKHGLAFKLAVFILTSTSIIFLAAFAYNYWCSKEIVLKSVEKNFGNQTQSVICQIESVLKSVEKVPAFSAKSIENRGFQEQQHVQLMKELIEANPEVYGGLISFEPYSVKPDAKYYAPYFCWDNNKNLTLSMLGSESYDYFNFDWYLIPKELNAPFWSEPYFDEGGGNVLMTTYSVPFYKTKDGKRDFYGIATADISLEWLVKMVSSISIYKSGYASIISQNGNFITHPNKEYIMKESIFSIAEAANDNQLRAIGKDMIHGGRDFVQYKSHVINKKAWMYYAPIPSTKWTLAVVAPDEELFEDTDALSKNIFGIGLAGFILLTSVVIYISRKITQPIRNLAHTSAEIAKGNLDIALPINHSNDEVGELSESFENMRVALKEYIHDLTETTAAKERIESELKIAKNIQMSFLPKKFPPFPEKEQFEIFALLEPAKEVGGDLYDFFLLDDNHLFFSVGDVSGKGVPAALFMAVSKTLMKGTAELGISPAELLMKVNEELAIDNDTAMFVTVFCAILNFKTGELQFSNAAHNKPILIRNNNIAEWLNLPGGFLLGPMTGTKYENRIMYLQPGDELIVYTDGVSEAMNPQNELFSDERLLETVGNLQTNDPESHVHELLAAVKVHAQDEPQSDDITIMSLKFIGE